MSRHVQTLARVFPASVRAVTAPPPYTGALYAPVHAGTPATVRGVSAPFPPGFRAPPERPLPASPGLRLGSGCLFRGSCTRVSRKSSNSAVVSLASSQSWSTMERASSGLPIVFFRPMCPAAVLSWASLNAIGLQAIGSAGTSTRRSMLVPLSPIEPLEKEPPDAKSSALKVLAVPVYI